MWPWQPVQQRRRTRLCRRERWSATAAPIQRLTRRTSKHLCDQGREKVGLVVGFPAVTKAAVGKTSRGDDLALRIGSSLDNLRRTKLWRGRHWSAAAPTASKPHPPLTHLTWRARAALEAVVFMLRLGVDVLKGTLVLGCVRPGGVRWEIRGHAGQREPRSRVKTRRGWGKGRCAWRGCGGGDILCALDLSAGADPWQRMWGACVRHQCLNFRACKRGPDGSVVPPQLGTLALATAVIQIGGKHRTSESRAARRRVKSPVEYFK